MENLSKNIFLVSYFWEDFAGKYGEALRDPQQMKELLDYMVTWLQEDWDNERRCCQVFKDIMFDYIRAVWDARVANSFERTYLNIFD